MGMLRRAQAGWILCNPSRFHDQGAALVTHFDSDSKPTADGRPTFLFPLLQVSFTKPDGTTVDRLPPWIQRVTQDLSVSPIYDARFWNPPKSEQYTFKNQRPCPVEITPEGGLKIYEAHVGISTPEPKVGSYKEFEETMLPRIKELGYNCIQM